MESIKTFILYNVEDDRSVKNAKHCIKSFEGKTGYEPELYAGCWKTTLFEWKEKYGYWEGWDSKKSWSEETGQRKLATFYSHYSLWQKCLELNKPIIIVEHDTECLLDLNVQFNAEEMILIQLTAHSMFDPYNLTKSGQIKTHWARDKKNINQYNSYGKGQHDVFWKHPKRNGRHLAGNTGQLMTVSTAKYFIDTVHEKGWRQNDLIETPSEMKVQYVNPSPIKWIAAAELNLSSGRMG